MLTAALVTRAETIRPPAGLTDREFRDRPRRRRLPFGPGERRANQRTMYGPFFFPRPRTLVGFDRFDRHAVLIGKFDVSRGVNRFGRNRRRHVLAAGFELLIGDGFVVRSLDGFLDGR